MRCARHGCCASERSISQTDFTCGALTLCALVVDVAPERQENVTSQGPNGCSASVCGLGLHFRCCAALSSGPLTGPRHPPVRLYNVHLRIMSAFARADSLGFFVLVLRVPTCLTPPRSALVVLFSGNEFFVCSCNDGGSSQIHRPCSSLPPMYPAASNRESGENAVVITIGLDAIVPSKTTWSFATSQTFTRPSWPPDTRYFPWESKAKEYTPTGSITVPVPCPLREANSLPVAISQTLTVLSVPPVAMRRVIGIKAIASAPRW